MLANTDSYKRDKERMPSVGTIPLINLWYVFAKIYMLVLIDPMVGTSKLCRSPFYPAKTKAA